MFYGEFDELIEKAKMSINGFINYVEKRKKNLK